MSNFSSINACSRNSLNKHCKGDVRLEMYPLKISKHFQNSLTNKKYQTQYQCTIDQHRNIPLRFNCLNLIKNHSLKNLIIFTQFIHNVGLLWFNLVKERFNDLPFLHRQSKRKGNEKTPTCIFLSVNGSES